MGFVFAVSLAVAPVPRASAQLPDHPIITEIYTDPPGVTDGPVGRLASNLHQSFIELYLPPASALDPAINKDALRLAYYDVEGDFFSSSVELVNYRHDLPTFDLDPSNGLTAGAIARPASGVVVLGWVDYVGNPPTDLAGTPSTRIALVRGGITATSGDWVFVAINGHHFSGTTNFPICAAESLIDLPAEATSGVIPNGSSAFLLLDRDSPGYVELCDDKNPVPCGGAVHPHLPDDLQGLATSALFDGFASNDHARFRATLQPYSPPTGKEIDLETVLPLGGAFTPLVPQIPETSGVRPAPGLADGYARVFIDVPKTSETASILDDDLVVDALNAYRHVRNNGPFFPTPGTAPLTTSPPELSVALAPEQFFEVLTETTGRPGVLTVNAGGNFGIDMTAVPGATSDPAVVTFGAGNAAQAVLGQQFGFPSVAVTPAVSAVHGSTATASVTITASNTNGADPAVLSPIQVTSMTATVLKPTTGLDINALPFQATVFAAVQGVPAQAGVANEFLMTDLGALAAANLGGIVQAGRGNGVILADPTTDLNDGGLVQGFLIEDFPVPGFFINFPGPPGKLDLVQTVVQSAEVLSGSKTYLDTVNVTETGLNAIRLNHPDTLTFGGTFTPSETVHFANAAGRVADPRSGLSNATTSRTFELAIVDSNVRDNGTIENGLTDDFGIIVEVQDTEVGAPVVDGEFVFLSFMGGLQGTDLDSLDVPGGPNIATIIYLDLDNLHDVLGIRTIEQIFVIDGSGGGEVEVIEVYSLNPIVVPPILTSAAPATTSSLWRSRNNIARFTFSKDITAPLAGNVLVQQMLPTGLFGADLSAGFQFTVENDVNGLPRILKVMDTGLSDLVHRQWYAIRNIGGWLGVADFTVQYVVQVGDADADKRILNGDVSLVNTAIPLFFAADDDRRDIDGDRRVLNGDVSTTNVNIPSFPVAKPTGH